MYIGITGHRYLAEVKKISNALEKALETINNTYPNEKKSILSLLAEGADRLIVPIAMKYLDAELYVIVPSLIKNYIDSFNSSTSKEEYFEILSKSKNIINVEIKNDLFKELSDFLVKKSDVLIAIWDGKPERGVGGTGYVVKKAITDKIPLIIISAGNQLGESDQAISLGKKQGQLILKYFKAKQCNNV